MHEMSYVQRFVNIALSTAEQENAARVTAVRVAVGEMTGVLAVYLKKYYTEAVKGTLLEGSELIVDEIPVRVSCTDCGQEYLPKETPNLACPCCGSARAHILSGRELAVTSVEIEE